ncbi:hypothetical protein AABB24_008957 [Solanum stoloniferum]|uniref:Uncharacterized protein n=1 Tax=Solanum stoloniferum TaxID=62892 RepID=A0ABD2UI20_9SOLN
MNYKAFTLILFVLIFCLSSTMTSRRILSGPGNSKMPSLPHRPKADGSATTQPPPVAAKRYVSYGTLKRNQVPVCNETAHINCIRSPPTVSNTRCNLGERCKRTIVL